jgi:hypothetical protein
MWILSEVRFIGGFGWFGFFIHKLSTLLITCGDTVVFLPHRALFALLSGYFLLS